MENPLVILIGADESSPEYKLEYIKSHIGTFSGVATSAVTGDELAIDRISFTVNLEKYYRVLYSPTDADAYQDTEDRLYAVREDPGELAKSFLSLAYATPVRFYLGDRLIGKLYSAEVERLGYTDVQITAVSPLGILEKQRHLGGLYTGQLMGTVLSNVIGDGAFPYTVSDDVKKIKVYNWLPIESRREALHQLLFAHGVNITKDEAGDMVFDFLQQTTALQVPEKRSFENGRAVYTPPATRIDIIEHSFFALSTDTDVVLFDNTDGSAPAGNSFVAFQEAPVYGLNASSGLVIHESGVNYAIVSGVGILTGKRYNHQTNRITRDNPSAGQVEKVVSSEGCTLVSVLNSSNVTRRLLSYHTSAQKVTMDIDVESERPGDQIIIKSPFRERITAFITSMQYSITGFMRARCELVTNYQPTSPGGGDYTHSTMITSSGAWTVPSGVDEVTFILGSGGTGGSGGYDGTNGTGGASVSASAGASQTSNAGTPGKGGNPGAPGAGGRIFQVRVSVSPGDVLLIQIGAGGAGGASNGGAGGEGGATTVTLRGVTYSSSSGAVSASGYYDVMNQRTLAVPGDKGTPGADGGKGRNGNNPLDGFSGESCGTYSGGIGGVHTQTTGGQVNRYGKPESISGNIGTSEVSSFPAKTNGYEIDSTYTTSAIISAVLNDSNIKVNVDTGNWSIPNTSTAATANGYSPSGYTSNRVATVSGDMLTVTQYANKGTSSSPKATRYTYPFQSKITGTAPGWSKIFPGGGGGGAAVGNNGGSASGKNGGRGANAAAPSAVLAPGSGGNGGNGGGGGGAGSGVRIDTKVGLTKTEIAEGSSGGAKGSGSTGGRGASGFALLYY